MTLKLGDVGTNLRLENDHIKVWDLILEPGEASAWHRHTMHYVFVVYEAGRLRGEFEDGTDNEKDYILG